MEDDEKVVKVNFKDKRPKAKLGRPEPGFFQTRTAGIIVLGALIALGLAIHSFLLAQ